VLERGDQETSSPAGWIKDRFVLLRVNNRNNKIYDMARGSELSRISLRAKDRKKIFKSIPQLLAVVVFELVP